MSKARKTHDLVATIGTYKDRDGNEKKRYLTCGVVLTDDEGRMSIKQDCVPVSPEWGGWYSLYPADKGGERQHQATNESHRQESNGRDDIPF